METRTILITGAKGGLGKALTHEFRENGWLVIATDLEAKIQENNNKDERIREITMDVRSGDSVGILADILKKEGTMLDLVVNNAGIDDYFPLAEAPVERFLEMFNVNVFGAYRVNQSFLPVLKKPGGRIIHVSSEAVKINVPFMTYPITKQTLEGYSRTLRQELRFLGIDVTLIRPGAIRTPFLEYARNMKNPVPDSLLKAPFEKFASQAPGAIGKTVEPEAVAKLIYTIANIRRSKPVYRINNSSSLSIASVLPFSWFERMVWQRLK